MEQADGGRVFVGDAQDVCAGIDDGNGQKAQRERDGEEDGDGGKAVQHDLGAGHAQGAHQGKVFFALAKAAVGDLEGQYDKDGRGDDADEPRDEHRQLAPLRI